MIAAHKGEIPFVVFLIPFIAGIACGLNLCPNANILFPAIAFTVAALLFICLNFLFRPLNLYKYRWLGGLLFHIVLFFAGWICFINYNELNKKDHFSKKQADRLIVKISNEPKVNNGTTRFTAVVQKTVIKGRQSGTSGNLLISIKDSLAGALYYGDELIIPASYRAVEPPLNPAEFNYQKYLSNQDIHYQEYLFPGQYRILKRNRGNAVIAFSLRQRQHLIQKFRLNMHVPEAVAVASTLVLGYKADLRNDVLQAYSKTGTIHVLSVSGAHVALLFIMLEFVLSFLNRFKYGRLVKATLIILIIWYYSMLTGFSPAVCRAAVMISMVIIGKTYSRNINTLNILAVSAFFLLLYDPLFIVDVGFQLSYLAVFGLVVLQPIVYKWFDFSNTWGDKLWGLCSISIAAQVITFPLSAFYFHQFPVYFLVSNLFIVIPVAIIMYTGFAYMILGAVPFLGGVLGFVLEKSILIMDKGLALIEHAPFATVNRIWITPLEYIALYIIIISLFYYLYDRKIWLLKLTLISLLVLSVSISLKRWKNAATNEITFLALRKHTGIVFKKGSNALILTDLSDTDKIYRYSIQPYLDSCQVSGRKIMNPDSDIIVPFLRKRDNYVQFGNRRLMIYGKQFQYSQHAPILKIDYLYLKGNPSADVTLLNKIFDYKILIVDGSNSNQLTSRLENEAKLINKNYATPGRNKSVTLVSN